jgi:DNA-directed RNA polymerase subunit RPC12/RpoP
MSADRKEKSACSEKNMAFPTEIVCPKCAAETEIWSDEDETHCGHCGYIILKCTA